MHTPSDRVQLDALLVPVVLVLNHLPGKIEPGPALLHEWTVVDHVLGSRTVFRAVLLDRLFRLREEDRKAHQLVKVRNPPFQSDNQLVLADSLDPQAVD